MGIYNGQLYKGPSRVSVWVPVIGSELEQRSGLFQSGTGVRAGVHVVVLSVCVMLGMCL